MSTIDSSSAWLWDRMESCARVGNQRSLRRLSIGAQVANLSRGAVPSCVALAAMAVCTWASFHFGQGFAFTGFLYLVFVVLTAMYGGFWQATLISVVAASCLNYFFVPPIFSFVNSAENWVALGAFEFTALVISRLSLRAQLRANEAIAGQRDMERLYQTSRRILLLDSSGEPGNLITALIQEIFALQAVQLFEGRPCQPSDGSVGG